MKQFTINQTYYKVLLTISEFNKKSYFPLNEGIYKILRGVIDKETAPFISMPTFETLSSYSSKKVCRLTLMLFRHGYIGKIYDPVTKKLYFRTTEQGEKALQEFSKKHRCSFTRKKAKNVITIAKIV